MKVIAHNERLKCTSSIRLLADLEHLLEAVSRAHTRNHHRVGHDATGRGLELRIGTPSETHFLTRALSGRYDESRTDL